MEDGSESKVGSSTATLVVLVIVTFFTSLYMKGLNSGIPYYYDRIGYSATVGGTFVAVFTLSATVMRLIGGQITDHVRHMRVLLASLSVMFFGVALPAVWDGFAVAMASRVLQGSGFAVATNVMTVAVAGSSSKRHIGKRLGIKGAGTSLGTMLGALVSVWLLDDAGYRWFYVFYAALMLAALVAVLWLRRSRRRHAAEADIAPDAPSRPKAKGTGWIHDFIAPFLIPEAAPFMIISFAKRIPTGFCVAFILVFARHASIPMGASFFVVAGATTLVLRLAGGKVFDSDRSFLLLPLQSVQILGFIVFALFPSYATLLVAALGYGISVGTTSPLIKALLAKATPKEHWGAVNGELFFFSDIGKATSAFVGGLVIDALTKTLIPQIALGATILSSLLTAVGLLVGRFVWKGAERSQCAR